MIDAALSTRTKIFLALAAAAIIAAGIIASAAWSDHKVAQLERGIDEAKQTAAGNDKKAAALERDVAAYREKIAYLENGRNEIRDTARKQDEQITNQHSITRTARADVGRVRRVRSNDATLTELCQKLAALGHACSE